VLLCWLGVELGGGLAPETVASLRLPVFSAEEDLGERAPQVEGHRQPASYLPGKRDRERTRLSEEVFPFVLSEALPVVPGKLVQRIQKGEYIEMAELLKDNVEAERRRVAAGDSGQAGRTCRSRTLIAGCSVLVCTQRWYVLSTHRKPGSCGLTRP